MKCPFCNEKIDRKTKIDNNIIEKYKNVYGTWCPFCHKFIKSEIKPVFIKEIEEKENKLKYKFLNKLRKKIFKEYN